MKLGIKAGDEVAVIAGSDKGKKGSVLEVQARKMKIRIKDICLQTCFDKEKGIYKREGFIDYSNVKLISQAPSKPFKKGKKSSKKNLFKGRA